MRQINKIIIHCSDTPEGRDDRAKDIDSWHRAQGYSEIGYHYVITLSGEIEIGRPEQAIGAHCKGHNAKSIGICYIGGASKEDRSPKDTRTPEQKRALLELLKVLKQKYPQATVFGHHDFNSAKSCPCFDAKQEYKHI